MLSKRAAILTATPQRRPLRTTTVCARPAHPPATQLIMRMVESNPSPRYMTVAVEAFRTGSYAGRTFSGGYGDFGAAAAAIVSDREARSVILDIAPTHGR